MAEIKLRSCKPIDATQFLGMWVMQRQHAQRTHNAARLFAQANKRGCLHGSSQGRLGSCTTAFGADLHGGAVARESEFEEELLKHLGHASRRIAAHNVGTSAAAFAKGVTSQRHLACRLSATSRAAALSSTHLEMEKIIVFKQRFASASLTPVVHNRRVAMRL